MSLLISSVAFKTMGLALPWQDLGLPTRCYLAFSFPWKCAPMHPTKGMELGTMWLLAAVASDTHLCSSSM